MRITTVGECCGTRVIDDIHRFNATNKREFIRLFNSLVYENNRNMHFPVFVTLLDEWQGGWIKWLEHNGFTCTSATANPNYPSRFDNLDNDEDVSKVHVFMRLADNKIAIEQEVEPKPIPKPKNIHSSDVPFFDIEHVITNYLTNPYDYEVKAIVPKLHNEWVKLFT